MAHGATVHNIDIDLADNDRGVYESLALRVARHPSESEEYLVARVLAYALEFADGIAFSAGGLSNADEPAMTIRDLTGAVLSWIESAPRMRRGCTGRRRRRRACRCTRTGIRSDSARTSPARRFTERRTWKCTRSIGRSSPRSSRGSIAGWRLRCRWSDRELFVSIGADTLTGAVSRVAL